MTKISIVCSDENHPVVPFLLEWKELRGSNHDIQIVHNLADLDGSGDFLFLVSCSEIVPQSVRAHFRHSLVLHASDLPIGRGWSPHIWEILAGANEITLTLLEADMKVDSGKIWAKKKIALNGTELYGEINSRLFEAELRLMTWAIENSKSVEPVDQLGEATYYRKRTLEDSRLDPSQSISEQFDLLRICDADRYPAFFEFRGGQYTIRLEKRSDE